MKDKRMHDGTKLLWHMDRVISHFDNGERIAPLYIDMGISKFCNIGCVFCFGKYQTYEKKIIEREPLLRFVKEAGEVGVRGLVYIGDGEPTVNPHLYETLYTGKKAGLSQAVSTNGVLLDTEEKRKAILENCEYMRFCFSAGTKEGYKKMHSVDKFDTAVRNIEALVNEKARGNYKTDIGMQAVFVPTLMADEMIEEAKLAVKLGVNYFVVKQCSLPDHGESGMMQFDVNDYNKPEIIEKLKTAESFSTDKTNVIVKWGTMDLSTKRRPYDGCLSVPLIWEASGNGDCFPCGYFFGRKDGKYDEYKLGNLNETGLKDMINSDKYWAVMEKMKTFDVHKDCHGQCRLDLTNKFVSDYLDKPMGVNFI